MCIFTYTPRPIVSIEIDRHGYYHRMVPRFPAHLKKFDQICVLAVHYDEQEQAALMGAVGEEVGEAAGDETMVIRAPGNPTPCLLPLLLLQHRCTVAAYRGHSQGCDQGELLMHKIPLISHNSTQLNQLEASHWKGNGDPGQEKP